ncbi:tetratricopeptide repeat protein [Noviherbaspirillum galbum]|uniref:Tetratricopeptide repeat protein n=1 Tax=Noviherbaspirillum galbum TaxID=2709383 RepID=A0A6B3SLN7_9BURK|nr:tetratricopeptide repeat protein [Noviherbaspirillum galbum]NEX61690.1 tetratricopeptide repeat protein [Noviherbaspirillum galbum]
MTQFRFAHIGLLLAAIGLNTVPALFGAVPAAYAAGEQQTLRPEVGKPLQAAGELMKAHKYKEALAKVRETDAIGGKTPQETYTIERMRASIAAAAGDTAVAIKSFEYLLDSGKLAPAEQTKFTSALGAMYYQQKDYPKAISTWQRYFKEGGDDPKIRTLLNQTYYLAGDYPAAQKAIAGEVAAEEKAGQAPSEEQLQLLANIALKQNDKAAYVQSIEKLVAYYPKKEYWADLINRVQGKPGFSDRLTLDVYRLKMAIGQMKDANDYMEMAQLALQAGFPAEAVKVMEAGYKAGALGNGAEAERQKRLRDLANKQAADDQKTMAQGEAEAQKAKDGTALVNLGYAYVTAGQADKGLALMDQGIKKGNLKRPDDAKLHYGVAQLQAGKKSEGVQTLKSVQGNDGTADLARYWILQSNSKTS